MIALEMLRTLRQFIAKPRKERSGSVLRKRNPADAIQDSPFVIHQDHVCSPPHEFNYQPEADAVPHFVSALQKEGDQTVTVKLFHRAGRVAFADTKKYYYTYNAAGITKSAFSSGQMDYFTVSEELEHFARENYPGLEKLVRARETDMAVSLLRKLSCTPERDRFAREEKELVKAVRRDVLGFLFSRYPAAKKLSALALSAFPHMTLELFAALFSSR